MKKILHSTFIFLFLQTANAQSEISGLASPIQLETDTTIVYLEDYFTDVSVIQKIETPDILKQELSADKKILKLTSIKNEIPFLSELKITTAINTYSILMRKSKKEKVTFAFDAQGKTYSKVSIVGDFTGWNPNVIFMENKKGIWQAELVLNPGRYQYQIVADGNWFLDPSNSEKIDNGIGGYNSLMKVGSLNKDVLPYYNCERITEDTIWINHYDPFDEFNSTLIFLWDNFIAENSIDGNGSYYVVIPGVSKNKKRSFIRLFSFNQFGESNDLLIPLEYGKVITDPSLLEKDDFQKTIMYFMMVDRFNNGDTANDNPVQDDRVLPQANYYGGDLTGILKKIDEGYFQSLGVNSLWISPVFQNPYNAYQEYPPPHRWFSGYHGYWPISLSQVDTRFGNNLLFKNLIDDAHNNSMSVYLDYVANHIHEQHPLWGSNPEYFSNLILPDGRKNLRLWDEQRLTTWFEPYMPSFDHSQKNVAELCADSAMYWLKEFNLDGFRHDATKHIETEFWRILTQKIKTQLEIPQQRNIYQIGETFGSRELISSYLGSGMLNAQFDFNLYFDARSVFALDEISFERLSASLHETFYYYGWHHVMGNITGNHDMARFISYASGDLKFTENDKEAGWLRKIDVTNPVGYSKLKMLHAFNMTIPGIPIIYYGDEIGIPGANDPDNRRMMRFDSLSTNEQDVKNTVIELSKLRSEHMALLYGDFQELLVNDTIYAYKRSYFSDTVITIFNKSGTSFQYQIPLHTDVNAQNLSVHFDSVVSELQYTINPGTDPGTYHSMSVTVKPYSFEIITFK